MKKPTGITQMHMEDEDQSGLEIHLAELNTIWQEVMVRLQIRERTAQLGITIQGVLLAIALGTQPINALAGTNFSLSDILLLSPLAAFVFQAMHMRQSIRISAIGEYLQTDLNERLSQYLEENGWVMKTGGGALSWMPFSSRKKRRFGGPIVEMILTVIEFNILFLLGIFGLMVYLVINPQPYNTLFFGAAAIWVLSAIFFFWMEMASFQMLTGYKSSSPEEVISSYFKAIEKGQLEYALSLLVPSIRYQEMSRVERNCNLRLHLHQIEFLQENITHPTKKIIKVTAGQGKQSTAIATYNLVKTNNLWYIEKLEEKFNENDA